VTRRAAGRGVLALLLTVARTAAGASPGGPVIDVPTFHGDARRLGWNAEERHLGPARVGGPDFGPLWSSPALEGATLDGRRHPSHLYATPL
jgi:hypothetical protein